MSGGNRNNGASRCSPESGFWFAVVFQNVFAYVVSLSVYQIGTFVLEERSP